MPRKRRSSRSGKGATRQTGSNVSRHSWKSFAIGFACGLLGTLAGLYLYSNGLQTNIGAGIKNLLDQRALQSAKQADRPASDSGDPQPVFDFYTVLPEYETVVDDKQFIREAEKPKQSEEASKASYMLQAASYSAFKDADKLKAKLALNGLASRIEKITVEGKGNFYRVRLGPYSNARTMSDVDRRLKSLGIKPLHLKVQSGN